MRVCVCWLTRNYYYHFENWLVPGELQPTNKLTPSNRNQIFFKGMVSRRDLNKAWQVKGKRQIDTHKWFKSTAIQLVTKLLLALEHHPTWWWTTAPSCEKLGPSQNVPWNELWMLLLNLYPYTPQALITNSNKNNSYNDIVHKSNQIPWNKFTTNYFKLITFKSVIYVHGSRLLTNHAN